MAITPKTCFFHGCLCPVKKKFSWPATRKPTFCFRTFFQVYPPRPQNAVRLAFEKGRTVLNRALDPLPDLVLGFKPLPQWLQIDSQPLQQIMLSSQFVTKTSHPAQKRKKAGTPNGRNVTEQGPGPLDGCSLTVENAILMQNNALAATTGPFCHS